jgi:hypothetical protein
MWNSDKSLQEALGIILAFTIFILIFFSVSPHFGILLVWHFCHSQVNDIIVIFRKGTPNVGSNNDIHHENATRSGPIFRLCLVRKCAVKTNVIDDNGKRKHARRCQKELATRFSIFG